MCKLIALCNGLDMSMRGIFVSYMAPSFVAGVCDAGFYWGEIEMRQN